MSVTKGNVQRGEAVMLWIDGKVVALSTSCAISYNTNMIDGSSKDDGSNENQTPGTLSWSATNDFILTGDKRTSDLDFEALLDLWQRKQPIVVTRGVPTGWDGSDLEKKGSAWAAPTTGVRRGKAYITSMSETHQKGQNSTGNISLQGIGEWEKVNASEE